MRYILLSLLLLTFAGCGFTKDKSKSFGDEVSSSFKKADEKEDLLEAREKVVRSRDKYRDCVDDNPSESSCENLKLEYEQNVERYTELQDSLNEL